MDIESKIRELERIYREYETAAAEYKTTAVCRPGCAGCCIHFGAVDITTLEGMVIRQRIQRMPKTLQRKLAKQLARNRRAKENGKAPRCPFLAANDTCRIYPSRPFSCRQLYSLKRCDGGGPTVHRRAVALARAAVLELQALDHTGYSGHLSYILHLLDDPRWRAFYLSGGFDPAAIIAYGKSHGIVINRMIGGKPVESGANEV